MSILVLNSSMEFQKSLCIPIAGSEGSDFVEVFPDELPTDVNDLLDVLKAEVAPLKIWKEAAVRAIIVSLRLFEILLRWSIIAKDSSKTLKWC